MAKIFASLTVLKHAILVAAVAVLVLALPPAAQAATIPLTDPLVTTLGLSQGDTFRMVFVTSATTNATSTDITTYNTFVTNLAKNLAGNTGSIVAQYGDWSWSVIGSTSAVDAIDNTLTTWTDAAPGHPIFLVGGGSGKVANDYKDLWDGSLQRAIGLNQKGTAGGGWTRTGTAGNGVASSVAGVLGGTAPMCGTSQTYTTSQWISRDWDTPSNGYPMYGMSGAITVVPEPATLSMLALGGLAILRRRRKRRS